MGVDPHAIDQIKKARDGRLEFVNRTSDTPALSTEVIEKIRLNKTLAIEQKRKNLFLRACKEIDDKAEEGVRPVLSSISFHNCPRLGHNPPPAFARPTALLGRFTK